MSKITLKSKRFDTTYEAEIYRKDQALVIRHTSLDQIYWALPDKDRPQYAVEPFDLTRMPGIPPAFTVKVKMKLGDFHVEQIGELLCTDWEHECQITKSFPLTICQNRAFDRAFIRYMSFDISPFDALALYSSSEIPVDQSMIPLTSRSIQPDTIPTVNVSAPPVQKAANTRPVNVAVQNQPSAASANDISPVALQNAIEAKKRQDRPAGRSQQLPPQLPPQQNTHQMPVLPNISGNGQIPASVSVPDNIPSQIPDIPSGYFATPEMFNPYEESCADVSASMQTIPPTVGAPAPIRGDANPFPYMNGSAQNNGYNPYLAPAAPVISRVFYDSTRRKTCIETDKGTFSFAPDTDMWELPSPNMQIDLQDLYNRSSSFLGRELSTFRGFENR